MKPDKKIFGLERNVFFLGLTSFFNDMSSEMVFSIIPAFFVSVLKTGAGALGLAEGIAEAASNLMKIYSGRLSDTLKQRKVFAVIGYSISVFTRPFYVFAGSVAGVIGLRLVDRIGKGLRDAPRDALIALSTSRARSGRSFGFHRAMDTVGGILGPLLAFAILSLYPGSFDAVFVIAFVIGLLAISTLSLVTEVANGISKHDGQNGSLSGQTLWYLASVFTLSLGTLPPILLLLKTESLGIAITSIPLFYAAYNATYALFSLPAGRAADRYHSAPVMTLGYLFLIVGYGALIFADSSATLVLALLFVGMFSAFTDGVQRSHLSHLVGSEHAGSGYGYLNAATGFGLLIAGAGGGYLWQTFGEMAALSGAIAIIILGLALFLLSGAARPSSP